MTLCFVCANSGKRMLEFQSCTEIILPAAQYQLIVDHCRRKLAELYLTGETRERKAYGLVAGFQAENGVAVAQCLPLLRNGRFQSPYKGYMDRLMHEYAHSSVTPLTQRGWIADPEELFETIRQCRNAGMEILGSYHMHRVAWPHDPRRDTPTRLDTIMAAGSGIFMFIVSMVEPERPIIRAFFEGEPDLEAPVSIVA